MEYKPPSHYAAEALASESNSHADALTQYRQDEEARVKRMLESAVEREQRRSNAQSAALTALREQEERKQQLLQQQREQREATARLLQQQEDQQATQRLQLNVSFAMLFRYSTISLV